MYDYARINLGLSSKKFWRCSWYDLSLLTERRNLEIDRDKEREEMEWARMRIMWADFGNAHRSKKDKIRHPKDLIELSFDKKDSAENKVKVIDMEAVKRRLGSKIKKK